MRKSVGFTLIELLVVVSIIAILIAILLPYLGKAKQSALRIQCGSNLGQFAKANTMLAVDRKGYFRLTDRVLNADRSNSWLTFEVDPGGWDHIPWLNYELFDDLQDQGLDMEEFGCPNRGEEFIWRHGSYGWRIGFYVMSGRDTARGYFTAGGTGKKWVSPLTMDDDNELVMAADIGEYNTGNPREASYSHGPNGLIRTKEKTSPKDAGADGSFDARLDASVHFTSVDDLGQFGVRDDGGRLGYWYDSPAYYEANNP